MQLYRIMGNVRAGAGQPNAQRGQLGLVTVWVRSASEQDALERARRIMAGRHYESVSDLTTYLEQTSTLSAAEDSSEGGGTRTGYLNMRQDAMERGDGLFEVWYPEGVDDSRSV